MKEGVPAPGLRPLRPTFEISQLGLFPDLFSQFALRLLNCQDTIRHRASCRAEYPMKHVHSIGGGGRLEK